MFKTSLSIIVLFALSACARHQTRMPIVASENLKQSTEHTAQNRTTPAPSPLPVPTLREEITLNNGLRIIPKNVKLENEQWRYKIDVDYPQIEGTKNPAILNLNRQMKDLVTKKYQWSLRPPTKKDVRHYVKWPGVFNSVDMEYDVVLATDEVLSIYLIAYHYGISCIKGFFFVGAPL